MLRQLVLTAMACAMIESGNNPRAYNPAEDAVGILQIRPCMVEDCNRIVGRQEWTMDDRWSPYESGRMFAVYCMHYWPAGTPEQWARGWNGGPQGPRKKATEAYWAKVRREMERKR